MPIVNRPLRVMHIISGDLWAGAEVQAFTLLKHLHTKVALHVVLMNDGELAQRLIALQIPVTIVPETQLNSRRIVRKLRQLICAFKPDLVHTHRQKENILGSIANFLAAPFSRTRAGSLRTTHGAPEAIPKGKQKIQVLLDNWAGKYLQQAIISVSNELAEKLAKTFPRHKIHIVCNGVDSEALQTQATDADFRRVAPNKLHIGIIGRLEPVKRIDLFLNTAALLLKDTSITAPLQFHIIGEGRLKPELQMQADSLGIAKHTFFHGHRLDMASCIHSLDAIVMCSDHEGTPMTALECAALQTPLVAHSVGGLKEIFKDSPELLVSNHSADGYYHTLKKLIQSPPAPALLNPEYSAERNCDNTLNIYNALLK